MTYNLFFLLLGDPGRQTFDPDLLGEMVKIEGGKDLLNQIFNLIARYVTKVHSDEHICKCLLTSLWSRVIQRLSKHILTSYHLTGKSLIHN
jgi:hypothetical protein